MGGHDHHAPYTVPDYKIYRVEDVPILMKTKEALQAQGLRDPWLRNEVWRYNCQEFGNKNIRVKKIFLRGFRLGFVALIATLAGTTIYDIAFPPPKHGHEDHH